VLEVEEERRHAEPPIIDVAEVGNTGRARKFGGVLTDGKLLLLTVTFARLSVIVLCGATDASPIRSALY
jgi:hypothetical protein